MHFPIAFLILAYSLDILTFLSVPSLSPYLPTATDSTRASNSLLLLGLVSALPALLTGGSQAFLMISKSGIYDESGAVRAKVKAVVTHALLSDVVLAATAYIWWLKKNGEVAGWIVPAEGALLAGIVVVGGTGGTLTYEFGVGKSLGKVAGLGKKKN